VLSFFGDVWLYKFQIQPLLSEAIVCKPGKLVITGRIKFRKHTNGKKTEFWMLNTFNILPLAEQYHKEAVTFDL
jgi:hypothetical protein